LRRIFVISCISSLRRAGLAALLAVAFNSGSLAADEAVAAAAPPGASPMHSQVFAVINKRVVSNEEYELAFSSVIRQRYYHGAVPEAELAKVREEIKVLLVQRIVLIQEAERRGIKPDEKAVQEALDSLAQRFGESPDWRVAGPRIMAEARESLSEQSLVSQLEARVKAELPAPGEAEVRAFYDKNPALFTEPEQVKVSMILLAVDPSSPLTAWEGTRGEAQAIYKRLLAGADFADAARLHSAMYADQGGSMGYVHRGMLPQAVQERIDGYQPGRINEPIDLLEGVAIIRVDERTPGKKRGFADVEQRARELLVREQQDQAWKSLVDSLVAKADVKFMHAAKTTLGEKGAN
jgi:hypothetical protein